MLSHIPACSQFSLLPPPSLPPEVCVVCLVSCLSVAVFQTPHSAPLRLYASPLIATALCAAWLAECVFSVYEVLGAARRSSAVWVI